MGTFGGTGLGDGGVTDGTGIADGAALCTFARRLFLAPITISPTMSKYHGAAISHLAHSGLDVMRNGHQTKRTIAINVTIAMVVLRFSSGVL
jgi:hypothetical protein